MSLINKVATCTISELEYISNNAIVSAKNDLLQIQQLAVAEYSFARSFLLYDKAKLNFLEVLHFVELVALVSSAQDIRQAAVMQMRTLRTTLCELFVCKMVYKKLKHVSETILQANKLSAEALSLIKFIIHDLEHHGVGLEQDRLEQIVQLRDSNAELECAYDDNIHNARLTTSMLPSETAGLPTTFLQALTRDATGAYVIGTDYPTVSMVMQHAKSNALRHKLSALVNNRAYPENYRLLDELRRNRSKLASLLGYQSYADYDLSNQVASEPRHVGDFLNEISDGIKAKLEQEIGTLSRIAANDDIDDYGKFYPWAMMYLRQKYQKQANIDLLKIAEYFPLEMVLHGLFAFLKKIFAIDVAPASGAYWDEQIKAYSLSFNGIARGQIVLDMYPRDGKYTHARVLVFKPSKRADDNSIDPGTVVILTNFTKPSATMPSLLQLNEVHTLFHEFGHAMHALLIETSYSFMDSGSMAVSYGLPVKTDFVETPSQLLECWLREPEILHNISHHYITGEKLSIDTVQNLLLQNEQFKAMRVNRQVMLADVAIQLFIDDKPLNEIYEAIADKVMPYIRYESCEHPLASFLHLTSYGAKYYSYLWCEAVAFEIFMHFKSAGFADDTIGKKYCAEVLAHGGSVNPKTLLQNFLGRSIQPTAFVQYLQS